MRVRILQAIALVVLLHSIEPLVEPTGVEPGHLDSHYGETVELTGRVQAIVPNGEVTRVVVADGDATATVLTRARPPPLGASVSVRGQPSPGRTGPVLWAEGSIDVRSEGPSRPIGVDQALDEAPQRRGQPLAVAGAWPSEGAGLVGPGGRLAVEPLGIDPEPGRVVAWGRLTYDASQARYVLEATGWRPWTPHT